MRPDDRQLAVNLSKKLNDFSNSVVSLPGIKARANMQCLVIQIIDSIRRIKFIETIRKKKFTNIYIDPNGQFFDPLKAASWSSQNGFMDEAFWLVFLSTHFGKNSKTGWSLAKEIYRGNSSGGIWTWERIYKNFILFRDWLDKNNNALSACGDFGNHRKYQSLDAYYKSGTGMAVGSYIEWINGYFNHEGLIKNAISEVGNDPKELFHYLYNSMNEVVSFGRTAKFDYLTMVGKLKLANVVPGQIYIEQSTGPKRGCRLLFCGSITGKISSEDINEKLDALDKKLNLYFGMQVLEDALCNWQKSPNVYKYFGG